MNQEDVALKVKKLLALAKGASTKEEAEAAISKANYLINKYKLNQDSLNDNRNNQSPQCEVIGVSIKQMNKRVVAATILVLRRYFFIMGIFRKDLTNPPTADDLFFFGKKSDLELGIYAFRHMYDSFNSHLIKKSVQKSGIFSAEDEEIILTGLWNGLADKIRSRYTAAEADRIENASLEYSKQITKSLGFIAFKPTGSTLIDKNPGLFDEAFDFGATVRFDKSLSKNKIKRIA